MEYNLSLPSNKGTNDNQAIILEENGKLIEDSGDVSEVLNEFYINIVEQTTGKKPPVPFHKNVSSAEEEIDRLVEKYKDHYSMLKIKEKVPPLAIFLYQNATKFDIEDFINT